MTHDDSIQIAAKSLAQRPALARMSRGGKASGLETLGNVKPASASRPRGKFSALQSIENAQNAERISILREPVPIGRRNGLAPTRKARRAADAGEQGAGAIARATALEGSNRPGRKLRNSQVVVSPNCHRFVETGLGWRIFGDRVRRI